MEKQRMARAAKIEEEKERGKEKLEAKKKEWEGEKESRRRTVAEQKNALDRGSLVGRRARGGRETECNSDNSPGDLSPASRIEVCYGYTQLY